MGKWIQRADRIAAAIDRQDDDNEKQNEKKKFQQVRLRSVFSLIDFGKKATPFTLPLCSLTDLSPKEAILGQDVASSVDEYRDLYDGFIQELHQTPGVRGRIDRASFDRLYALQYKYLTSVPASTYEGDSTYVSLFDHMKLTAAIASCLAAGKQDSFRMIEFDISGIQRFIFQITEGSEQRKGVAKALRGRSFLISLLTDYITVSYLQEFGMTQANIIFNSGGGAVILLPDNDDFEERFNTLTARMQLDLYQIFRTDITFVASEVTMDEEELMRFKTDKEIELKEKLDQAKQHKFYRILDENFFVEEADYTHTCSKCQTGISEGDVCAVCKVCEDISNALTSHSELQILFYCGSAVPASVEADASFRIGDTSIVITSQKQLPADAGYDYIETINQAKSGAVRFTASMVPQDHQGIIPLDEVCEMIPKSYGDPKLGILKMDVDNLGAIFAYGFDAKTRSLSKFLALSRSMELFFGKILPDICREVSKDFLPDDGSDHKESSTDTVFYINYAGGDDLVILGPAAAILQLASRIEERFREYTRNPNITISAGIFIQRPKQPVRFGVLQAEKLLELSKERDGKNGAALLNRAFSYSEYQSLLEGSAHFKEQIEAKKISRSYFYQMMKVIKDGDRERLISNTPILLYGIKRNISDLDVQNEWRERISGLILARGKEDEKKRKKDQERRDKLVIMMQLAIMQTREG